MDPLSKKLLEETLVLAKENNDILRSMRRSMRFARIMSYLYWAFIILTAFGAYYFIEPYLEQLMSVYGGAKSNLNSLNDVLNNFKKIGQ